MFKSITPKFIHKIDAYFLVNHPILWMSKIHYVLWHGLILLSFSALLGFFMPISLKSRIEYGLWYFLFTVIAIVLLSFWIYRYVIFNKEKNYGSKKFSDDYKNFILVFISVATFLIIPWPFEMLYSQRVANMYTNQELIEDMNTLNQTEPYLANSTNNYMSWYDSTSNIQYFNIRKISPYGSSYYTPYYLRNDSSQHPNLLTEFQLSKTYKPISDLNILKQKAESFISVAKKYKCEVNYTAEEFANKYLKLLSMEKVTSTDFDGYGGYQYDLQMTLNNLCEAKFTTLFIFKSDYLWGIFYTILGLTSFLLLFKISYWQHYLITLVVLMLYPLLMFIFWQLMPYNSFMRSSSFYEASLLALILFAGITLFFTSKNNLYYKPFYNILNQIFYLTLIYSPLLVIAFLHDSTNTFHNHDYSNYSFNHYNKDVIRPDALSFLDTAYYNYWHEEYMRWLNYAKYFGIATFIVALPFFKELFVKQISLPKKS